MTESILGTRIRQYRRDAGITQAELARRVGISASYLNLIEWNKRRIGGSLLRRIADSLELSLNALDGAAERRLSDTLKEIARLPAVGGLDAEHNRTDELIGRFPGWSRCIAALARAERQAAHQAEVLSDRLSNDPFLGETVHGMLTRVASIRAAVEILTDYSDLTDAERARFDRIVRAETQRLTEVGEALTVYLDKAQALDHVLTPVDEVEALFVARANHFPEIEAAAQTLASKLDDPRPIPRHEKALEIAEHDLAEVVSDLLADQTTIETDAGRNRTQQKLIGYAVGALLMPAAAFGARARALHYDIEALAQAFSVPFDAVCLRLTALERAEGVPVFGYFKANAAGTIIDMLGLEGMTVPRYTAACPLWALFRAQQTPETVIRQRTLFPSGRRYVFIARARNQGPLGFGMSRHFITDMLVVDEDDSRRTVYAPGTTTPVEEVGPSCRLCPRHACPHRVEDPFAA